MQILNSTDKDLRKKSLEIRSLILNNYYSKSFSTASPGDTLHVPDSLMTNLLPLQSSDPNLLNEFANSVENRRFIVNRVITLTYPEAIKKAEELIIFLKKEYHLENE